MKDPFSPPTMGYPPFGLHYPLARCLPTSREFSSRHGLVVDFAVAGLGRRGQIPRFLGQLRMLLGKCCRDMKSRDYR